MEEFEQIYQNVFPRINGYIRLRVNSKFEADDLTQNVMIEGWKNWHRYKPQTGKPPEAWFLGIARHHVADYWRKNRVHFTLEDSQFETLLTTEDRTAEKKDRKELFEKLKEEMSEEGWRLLSLRYIDELSHSEIAALYDKQPAAIRKYFSRLESSLKQWFGKEWKFLNN